MKKAAFILTMICLAALVISACTNAEPGGTKEELAPGQQEPEEKVMEEDTLEEERSMSYDVLDENNPIATIVMENGDTIIIELYPNIAPESVNNFISLANSGFYDGVIFHRVIPGFMIQGGDPEGTGGGGPGYCIFGEFKANGFENNLSHKRGVVSMARKGDQFNPAAYYDSAGSQFFICVDDSEFLDTQYAAFGNVVYGMDAADSIANTPKGGNDRPRTEQKIKNITVATKGAEYPEPKKLPVK